MAEFRKDLLNVMAQVFPLQILEIPENLEILEILEHPQTVEKKKNSTIF